MLVGQAKTDAFSVRVSHSNLVEARLYLEDFLKIPVNSRSSTASLAVHVLASMWRVKTGRIIRDEEAKEVWNNWWGIVEREEKKRGRPRDADIIMKRLEERPDILKSINDFIESKINNTKKEYGEEDEQFANKVQFPELLANLPTPEERAKARIDRAIEYLKGGAASVAGSGQDEQRYTENTIGKGSGQTANSFKYGKEWNEQIEMDEAGSVAKSFISKVREGQEEILQKARAGSEAKGFSAGGEKAQGERVITQEEYDRLVREERIRNDVKIVGKEMILRKFKLTEEELDRILSSPALSAFSNYSVI